MYACSHGTYFCLYVLIHNWMIPHDWWRRMIRKANPCSRALFSCASLVGAMFYVCPGQKKNFVFLPNWSPPRIAAPRKLELPTFNSKKILVGAPIREWCVLAGARQYRKQNACDMSLSDGHIGHLVCETNVHHRYSTLWHQCK